jgi:Ser/Thr protein kinase RdoA (MazF antagonist)
MSDPNPALSAWDWPGEVRAERAASGLINTTWLVLAADGPAGVLQTLNTAIFDPRLHENIEAVTTRLAERGLQTPRIRRTRSGDLWHADADGGIWRVLTWVGDRTVDKLADPADARSAGALVARFHAATEGFDWDFRPIWSPALAAGGTRSAFHDTGAYMTRLEEAVPRYRDHRLYDEVSALSDQILTAWRRWDGPTDLPQRVVHGDLKISNVRFDGPDAVALIDLDTLSRGTLDAELGDAFRSWCNPDSEDAAQPRFHLGFFEAAVAGYAESARVTEAEWASIVPGVERICLELASRFCRDAVEESYFGFNPRYGGRGEHNLLRARGQYALARAVRDARSEADAILHQVRA